MVVISRGASDRLRIFLDCSVMALGAVAVVFTLPAFQALSSQDRPWGWLFLALGVGTVTAGAVLVVGRWRGKPLVLSRQPWRVGFLGAMALVYFTVFVVFARPVAGVGDDLGPLALPGSSAIPMGLLVCGLFVADETEEPRRKGRLRLTPARKKTAKRWLYLLGGGSALLVMAGLMLGRWVQPWFAETFVGPGVVGLLGTVVPAVWVRGSAALDENDPAPTHNEIGSPKS